MAPIAGRHRSRGGRDGAIAQLGERVVRNDEVGGSIPPGSTTLPLRLRVAQPRKPKPKRARRSPLGRRRASASYFAANLLPRKPRPPLLNKTRNTFAKIAA